MSEIPNRANSGGVSPVLAEKLAQLLLNEIEDEHSRSFTHKQWDDAIHPLERELQALIDGVPAPRGDAL